MEQRIAQSGFANLKSSSQLSVNAPPSDFSVGHLIAKLRAAHDKTSVVIDRAEQNADRILGAIPRPGMCLAKNEDSPSSGHLPDAHELIDGLLNKLDYLDGEVIRFTNGI
jgi:hypothetical protein